MLEYPTKQLEELRAKYIKEEYNLMWLIEQAYTLGYYSGASVQRTKDFSDIGKFRDRILLLVDGELSYWVNSFPHEINTIKGLKELKEEIQRTSLV